VRFQRVLFADLPATCFASFVVYTKQLQIIKVSDNRIVTIHAPGRNQMVRG